MAATPTSKLTAKPTPDNPAPDGPALDNPAWLALTSMPTAFATHPGVQWGVAYSGGADSTALLLAAVQKWPGQVHAIHIHHGLQAAADNFVRVCKSVCEANGVPLQVVQVDATPSRGESPEDAARKARYAALAASATCLGLAGVLLGQHADDQVETLLLALSRGAGLPGLSGMTCQFQRNGMMFYRPLLQTPAAVLRDWLTQCNIPFVEDPTNTDERYTRNRIRARLLPVLADAFPQFRQTFSRSARHAAQAQSLLVELACDDLTRMGTEPAIKALQALSQARQANLLRHWLLQAHRATASTAQLAQLLAQIAACTTRGHQIHLKVATGHVTRLAAVLKYTPAADQPG